MPAAENTVTLFEMKGTALHIESDEAQRQMLDQGSGMSCFNCFTDCIYEYIYTFSFKQDTVFI